MSDAIEQYIPTAFTVTARFRSDPLGWMRTDEHEVESVLEIGSFWRVDAVDTDGARKAAERLERIADVLEKREERELRDDEESIG